MLYFAAIERMPISVALLIQYCAPVLIVLVGAALAAVGLLPWARSTASVRVGSVDGVPWFVPMAVVVVAGTVVAYLASLAGTRLVGARVAAFVGLTEVVFAMGLAWLVVGESPTVLRVAGAAVVLVGVALVRSDGGRVAASGGGRDGRRDERSVRRHRLAPTPGTSSREE